MDWYVESRTIGMAVRGVICRHSHSLANPATSSKKLAFMRDGWLLAGANGMPSTSTGYLSKYGLSHFSKMAYTTGYKQKVSGWKATGGYRAYNSSSKDEKMANIKKQINEILLKPSEMLEKSSLINQLIEQPRITRHLQMTHQKSSANLLKMMAGKDYEDATVDKITSMLVEVVLKESVSAELLKMILLIIRVHGFCLGRNWKELRTVRDQQDEVIGLLKKILEIIEPRPKTNVI